MSVDELRTGLQRRELPSHRRLSVLLLCDDFTGHANTVLDHIAAFTLFSAHDVRIFNPIGQSRSKCLDLEEFDVVVIHYSIKIIAEDCLAPEFRDRIRQYQGLKVQFIQDEYRLVNEFTDLMRYLGIHVLFTLLAEPDIPKLYDEIRLPGVVKLTTLAGYVPSGLAHVRPSPLAARPVDIGYRGRTLPFWLGTLGQEKAWIGQGVLARAPRYHLRCDIGWAEEDRIYGQRWTHFLTSCKATLGTESGSSITDFDGTIERRTKAYLIEHPQSDFAEVHRAILQPYEDNMRVTAISPRVFEAAVLRTALVLFPGKYSGIIEPGVHFIQLAKDFSNLDEVVDCLHDLTLVEGMTERAYQDLVASGRYSHEAFMEQFDDVLLRYASPNGQRGKLHYRLARLERPCVVVLQKAMRPVRPVLRVLQGVLTLAMLLRIPAGRRILRIYCTDREFRKQVPVKEILRDVLKLAVVSQARDGAVGSRGRFSIAASFDPERRCLIFESRPLPMTQTNGVVHGAEQPSLWTDVATAVRERRIRTVVWNHTRLGGTARYKLAPNFGLRVCVGDYDLHSFEGFVQLAQREPESASSLLLSLLGPAHQVA
jgi:hypothetical protein